MRSVTCTNTNFADMEAEGRGIAATVDNFESYFCTRFRQEPPSGSRPSSVLANFPYRGARNRNEIRLLLLKEIPAEPAWSRPSVRHSSWNEDNERGLLEML